MYTTVPTAHEYFSSVLVLQQYVFHRQVVSRRKFIRVQKFEKCQNTKKYIKSNVSCQVIPVILKESETTVIFQVPVKHEIMHIFAEIIYLYTTTNVLNKKASFPSILVCGFGGSNG